MIEYYTEETFEGGAVGEKTEQVFAELKKSIGFSDYSKRVNGDPVVGHIEFTSPTHIIDSKQWFEYRSSMLQVCQEFSTEDIAVSATADNKNQKFIITIKATEQL